MRLLLLCTLAVVASFLPVTAQPFALLEEPAHPCGFHSPNAAAACTFLRTHFDTLSFQPGERIADIGAQSGNLAGIFSLFYDQVDMTLEDIDSNCLNPVQVGATFRYYYRMREHSWPQQFRTHLVIGSELSTRLPSAAYRKVFFMNSYHEVAAKEAMLAELYRITAPGGTLYVSEKVSTHKRIRRRDCGHGMPMEHELLQAFHDAGFQLAKTKEMERYRQKRDWVRRCCFQFSKG